MDKVDLQIDQLEREKIISLIQQNQVRIGKHNVRYTRSNKKHTLEHWEKCMESYERLLKSIPKDILKIEKEIRVKFVADFTPEREKKLLSLINTEIEVLIQKTEKLYQDEFRKFNASEDFTNRVNAAREKCQELTETYMEKCRELSEQNQESNNRMSPKEICGFYEMKDTFLHELNLLGPLQNINLLFKDAESNPPLHEAITGVHQGIRIMAKTLQDEGSGEMQSMKERKARKMQVARETLLFRDLVINMEPLIEQSILPEEKRNQEILEKLWKRIEGLFFQGRKDWSEALPLFKNVFEVSIGAGK